ncbi:hypothetical protein J1605_010105 [Eschrichtius robustus]|uniref:Uncharacterized protein n=1 Tax=Eschrichtius robustus TaxID=9764 RepID=A0AB34GTC2_ESCRO|nr:hypothetical protein J1605_010105 [Eschrichtius robustus]
MGRPAPSGKGSDGAERREVGGPSPVDVLTSEDIRSGSYAREGGCPAGGDGRRFPESRGTSADSPLGSPCAPLGPPAAGFASKAAVAPDLFSHFVARATY